MASNDHSTRWGDLARLGVVWALRQVLGLLVVGISLSVLVGAAALAAAVQARQGSALLATLLGAVGWLIASALVLYGLIRFLRLRRERVLGVWLLLSVVYLVVAWGAGGLPLVPRPPALGAAPVAAAERPRMVGGPAPRALAPAPATSTPLPPPTPVLPTATPTPHPTPTLPLWGKTIDKAYLWPGPDTDDAPFNEVPAGSYFRILEAHAARYRVYYGGDRARRQPGEAWLDRAVLEPADWPQFVRVRQATALRRTADAASEALAPLDAGSYLEVVRPGPGDWARVLYLGDGRDAGPWLGWVSAADLAPPDVEPERISRFLATAAALTRQPDVWLKVPYRSQIDGTPWAAANCGPTSVAMLLEAHGIVVDSGELRRQVMAFQGTPNCHDCGSFIQHLAAATEAHGLRVDGLWNDAGRLRRWTLDDLRAALMAGHPVLPQVKFRLLPGREDAAYGGDHYIVLTGVLGDAFLYNDPIDDGPAYGRLIAAEQLQRAMGASDFPYAAFAAGLP